MKMDDRKKRILQAIIDCYVSSAEPIGSRTISRRYDLGVSSATIRNEMSDLEEMGYLEQPHTSAGRIPSEKGYRFYVDRLMEIRKLADEEVQLIKSGYSEGVTELEYFIQSTSKILSYLTNYTTLVLKPKLQQSVFKRLHLIPVTTTQALLVIVTDTGLVENRLIDLPQPIEEDILNRISHFLSDKFQGLTGEQIKEFKGGQLEWDFLYYQQTVTSLIESLKGNLDRGCSDQIHLSGTTNMFSQPEFKNLEKIKSILNLLEKSDLISTLLSDNKGQELTVSIGAENKVEEMKDCSIVTATYKIGERQIGAIGIIGPTRMEYGKVVAVLDVTSKTLTDILTKIFN